MGKISKYHIVFLLLCIGCVSIPAGTSAEEGSHAAEFLSHGVGARALGMGSAFVSVADDATAAYWNPAGLTRVQKHAFSAMYSDSFGVEGGSFLSKGLVTYNFVNYVQQIEDIGTVGVSWIRLGVDDIPKTTFIDTNENGILGDFQDKNGNGIKDEGELYIDRPTIEEFFSNTDNAVLISYARQVNPKLAVGGNLKLLRQSIFVNSGSGFGIDLGLMVEPLHGLRIGAMLQDATGTQIRWNTPARPTFTRNRRMRLGVSYDVTPPIIGDVTVGADLETGAKDLAEGKGSETLFRIGAEYRLFKVVAFRVGADGDRLAAGSGLRLRIDKATLFVDYAFNAHDLGNSQRISISGFF